MIKARAMALNKQTIIVLTMEGKTATLECVRFHPNDYATLKQRGLVDKEDKVLSMNAVADNLADLINFFITMRSMGMINWDNIMLTYKPFIRQQLKWKRVEEFMNPKSDEEDWI